MLMYPSLSGASLRACLRQSGIVHFQRLNGTDKEAAEKRLFCALRFATRKPAAAWKYDFSVTYGTSELVP